MTITRGRARSKTAPAADYADPPSTLLYLMKQVELAVRAPWTTWLGRKG